MELISAILGQGAAALWLLGQAGGGGGGGGGPDPFLFALMPIMVLFYFMMMRPAQQKERRRREMLDNLKENDHVVTNGGLHGVVTGIHRDADRVTLRVDDATGVKVRVGLWAVSEVLGDGREKASAAAEKKDGGKKPDTKAKK